MVKRPREPKPKLEPEREPVEPVQEQVPAVHVPTPQELAAKQLARVAFVFPPNPAIDATVTGPRGEVWKWDGVKWHS